VDGITNIFRNYAYDFSHYQKRNIAVLFDVLFSLLCLSSLIDFLLLTGLHNWNSMCLKQRCIIFARITMKTEPGFNLLSKYSPLTLKFRSGNVLFWIIYMNILF
jgi:hypothetical protein